MTDLQVPDPDFELAVAKYLEAGMPARHGLSTEAYVARCRELWDSCETDDTCRYKALVDRRWPGDAWAFREEAAAYVDPRASMMHAVMSPEPECEPLYCTAVGVMPMSSVLAEDGATSFGLDDPHDPSKTSAFGLWIVAVLDVLGFERMYRRLGPQRMEDIYARLMATAQERALEPTVGMIRTAADAHSPAFLLRPVEFARFSDTILLWAPLSEIHASSLVASCADVLIEGLSLGIPLRGAVAVGEAILNSREGVFLGTPLIDAARLEHAQDWIGISLTRGCAEILPWLDSSVAIPFTAPCKSGTSDQLLSGFVVDWPRRARSRGLDALAALEDMHPPESHRRYYDNARVLIDHSGGNHRWNRDHVMPVFIRFLRTSVIRQCLDGIAMSPEALAMLDSKMLNEGDQVTPAVCLRALLDSGELPPQANALPEGQRGYIQNVQEVISGRGVDLEELMMAALEQRFDIRTLTQRQQADLATAPSEVNGEWQACMPFLSALAEGADIPEVPDSLPRGTQTILRFAHDAALGQYAPVDIEALLAGIVWAGSKQTAVSELNLKRLDALAAVGRPWNSVADFLWAVVKGQNLDVDLARFDDEGAVNIVQVVRNMLAIQQSAHCSVTDAVRMMEPIDGSRLLEIAFRVGRAVVHDVADDELDRQLDRLERAGSPHDAVARYFRGLLVNRCAPDLPGGLAADVSLYLQVVPATVFGLEFQLPLSALLTHAHEARKSLTAPAPYEEAVLGLLHSAESEEVLDLARYLALVATAETEPDVTSLRQGPLRAAVEALEESARASEAIPSLEDAAESALRHRRKGGASRSAYHAPIDAVGCDADSEIAEFLLGVATTPLLPQLSDRLDDQVRQTLMDCGIRALCEPLTLTDLANAVLGSRCYGVPLDEPILAAIEALTASPDPFRAVGRFLADLSVGTRWPPIPLGIPRLTLSLLASARQHASELSSGGVVVSRRHGHQGDNVDAVQS